MRQLFALGLFALMACGGPIEQPQPFIKVTVTSPPGVTAPLADTFEVTTSAIVQGNPISKTLEVSTDNQALPLSFIILFSEGVRGTVIDISMKGVASGTDVFTATTSAVADVSEVEAVARFCGDGTTDADRQ